ncbi:MAG: glycoside hydrolase family 31 protein [Actinomycetota bacterium]|nr:glycoside hydrolase family 31 protein [Actinomycetota bacterium]
MRPHLTVSARPVADPANVVAGENYRITVLDAGLLRLEYSPAGRFEDRPSQTVLNRDFPPAEFELVEDRGELEIHTERLHLVYDKGPFSPEGLSVLVKGNFSLHDNMWRFGQPVQNLGGTARTLDGVDGACELEDGVVSRTGIAVVDDSGTMLLTEDGWVAPRDSDNLDLYLFGYGPDYKDAVKALYALTGKQPLLPRFALGNWWSRYHPYSAEEYVGLMDRFALEHVPFAVGVIDMDWHITEVDPAHGSGWTGYTWNRDLFPDPVGFLASMHERDLKVSLNVHPADGIRSFEDAYHRVAIRMGIDPASGLPVNFNPADASFIEAYLEEVHHPLEEEGVDFWWVDWQSGTYSRLRGLDPLWILNHVHYLDSGRDGRRPLTFSRYAGVGSHRYPVGFSGDTVISWESLHFQPYFTATASNVGYGWWSHDIGGHFFGTKDDELATRWVQFGVFSPVLRLHSSADLFNSKEPWRFDERADRVMRRFLRLRHQLVPFLYSMNRRAHVEDEPLVQPMYYDHPWEEAAYQATNQYMFGSELMVAPITTPAEPTVLLGRVRTWIPAGTWIDFFTGLVYRGGRSAYLHRDLDSIPVLARAGAVVPLVSETEVANGTTNPVVLELRVFAGADGEFTLWEDADDERWASTSVRLDFEAGELFIDAPRGDLSSLPENRHYDLVLVGFAALDHLEAHVGGITRQLPLEPGPVPGSVQARVSPAGRDEAVRVTLAGDISLVRNDVEGRLFTLLERANIAFAVKGAIWDVVQHEDPGSASLSLQSLDLPPELLGSVSELLLAQ